MTRDDFQNRLHDATRRSPENDAKHDDHFLSGYAIGSIASVDAFGNDDVADWEEFAQRLLSVVNARYSFAKTATSGEQRKKQIDGLLCFLRLSAETFTE